MSGRKTSYVNIPSEEYWDLFNRSRQSDEIQGRIHEELNRRHQEITQRMYDQEQRIGYRMNEMSGQISNMRSEMRDLAQNLENEMAGVRQDLHDIRSDTIQRIEDSERRQQENINQVYSDMHRMDQKFQEQLDNQWDATLDVINKQEDRFNKRLSDQWQQTQAAFKRQEDDYTRRIQDLRNDIKAKEEYERRVAVDLYEDTKKYLELIKSNFNVEKFLPGKYAKLDSILNTQKNNINGRMYQAAVSGTQGLFRDVLEFRTEIEKAEIEWQTYLEEAERHTSATEVEVHENIKLCKLGIPYGDQITEYNAVIDKWTNNGMSDLYERVKNERKKLNKSEDLSTEELKKIIKNSVEYRQECYMLIAKAKHNILQSQLRGRIIDAFTSGFEGTGWELADEAWEEDDFNNAIYGKYRFENDEVVVIVSPKLVDDKVVNECEVHFFDDSNDPVFRHQRLKNIEETLKATGLEFSDFHEKMGADRRPLPENQAVREFERIRAKDKRVK